jgi:transposase InsO family protein
LRVNCPRCRRKHIKPRYGAVGKHGSISVIERFIRSFKDEFTRRIHVPLRLARMREESNLYLVWYNRFPRTRP